MTENAQVAVSLTLEQWNVVGAALDEAPMPRRISNPIYVAIAQQLNPTQKPAPDPVPDPATPEEGA